MHFNNKEPERIVQALLFAHRESGEKEFNKTNALRTRKELRERESLSGENLSFPFQTARANRPLPFFPLPLQRLLTDGEAARQEFVPLQGRETKPPVSPLHQCPFNNKEPERIVQALLFAHRESEEKEFNKANALRARKELREGGRAFLEKTYPSSSKTFDWWGGRATGVRSTPGQEN